MTEEEKYFEQFRGDDPEIHPYLARLLHEIAEEKNRAKNNDQIIVDVVDLGEVERSVDVPELPDRTFTDVYGIYIWDGNYGAQRR